MLVRQATSMDGVQLSTIKLTDRRSGAVGLLWTPQKQLETALYQSGYGTSTGAVYRLLHLAGVGDRSLPLKKAAISDGLITEDEYGFLYSHLGGRSFTLVPHAIIPTALQCFGRDDRSEAVLRALELPRPAAWAEQEHAAEEVEAGEEVAEEAVGEAVEETVEEEEVVAVEDEEEEEEEEEEDEEEEEEEEEREEEEEEYELIN